MNTMQSGTYTIDATHSNVEFAVKHMMITTVKGRFGDVSGAIELPENGQPKVDVTINTASIDTRTEARDKHLRSPDFFDVDKFPEIRFVSSSVRRTDDGYALTGDLTIKGITKSVMLAVTAEGSGVDPWGNQKSAFSATGKFNRSEFGLNWNAALEAGGVLVSDEVKLSIEAQLVKQGKAQAA